jgi:hypothetical protein
MYAMSISTLHTCLDLSKCSQLQELSLKLYTVSPARPIDTYIVFILHKVQLTIENVGYLKTDRHGNLKVSKTVILFYRLRTCYLILRISEIFSVRISYIRQSRYSPAYFSAVMFMGLIASRTKSLVLSENHA